MLMYPLGGITAERTYVRFNRPTKAISRLELRALEHGGFGQRQPPITSMSAEVVQAFADAPAGETWTFTRASLEKHMKSVCLGIHAARLPGELVPKPTPTSVKKGDVEYLVREDLLLLYTRSYVHSL